LQLAWFAWGIAIGIAICVLYGIFGGDEKLKEKYPVLTQFLHIIHHWQVGLLIMVIGTVLRLAPVLGFGLGLFIDDRIYHTIK